MTVSPHELKLQPTTSPHTEKGAWLSWSLVLMVALISLDAVVLGWDFPLVVSTLLFCGITIYKRDFSLFPCASLCFFLFVASRFYPDWVWRIATAPFLVPLVLAFLVCAPFQSLRKEWSWARKGTVDQASAFLVVLVSLVSAIALILWALWTNYLGVATQMLSSLKTSPRWFSLLILVPGFAVLNAFAEEAVYRGVLMDALEKCFPRREVLVLILQASAFAAAHFSGGFPNGKLGYLMTFLYAGMLGLLRRRTNGMLAPYLAHVAADLVIGFTLVLLAT